MATNARGYTGLYRLGLVFTFEWRRVHRFMACKTPIDTYISVNSASLLRTKQANTIRPTEQQHTFNRAFSGFRTYTHICGWAICSMSLAPRRFLLNIVVVWLYTKLFRDVQTGCNPSRVLYEGCTRIKGQRRV